MQCIVYRRPYRELGAPAYATVAVSSLTSSVSSPQLLGTSVTWTATGTDTGAGPLTFQFNVTPPGGSLMMIKDFNTGTLKGSHQHQPAFRVGSYRQRGQIQSSGRG